MAKNFSYNPNIGAVNGFGNNTPEIVRSVRLAATTDTSLTVPNIASTGAMRNTVPESGADTALLYAIFGYEDGATVFVANGVDATPNTTSSFATSSSAINPVCLLVKGGEVLHFYALTQKYVTVTFYPWSA